MKAGPLHLVGGKFEACDVDYASHVKLNIPGPIGAIVLPVILKGSRDEAGCWTWNGSTEAPTLRPSVLNERENLVCHSWINDGSAVFLPDSTHALAGQTVDLLDVETDADNCNCCGRLLAAECGDRYRDICIDCESDPDEP